MSSLQSTLAVLFPGQGAQYVGMGKALYDAAPAARAVLDEADNALGGGFLATLFDGPADKLTATDVSQAAIYAVSIAAFTVFRNMHPGVRIAAVGGLSLGEYSALTAAGCLPFSDGIKLVRQRGVLMQEAAKNKPGAMASVLGLEADTLNAVCSGIKDAYVANYNCPGQIVISGGADALKQAGAALTQAGARRVIPLQVSGAFHSPFMAEAQRQFAPLLNAIAWRAPQMPVLSNVTGMPHASPAEIPALLARQVVESVRWEDNCRWMLVQGVSTFCEIGPGKVLQGLMKKIEPAATVHAIESPTEIGALNLQ